MNKGDWIQLFIIIIVFLVLVVIIFSLMTLPWYVGVIEIVFVVIIGYLVNTKIKL